MRLEQLQRRYDAYVETYRGADGALPVMMRLKREHTAHVVARAREIADGERFDPPTREAVLAAALLHDTGRYEQLRRFDTFRDSESVDHAVFSHDIVRERGWLETFDAVHREAILAAILYHNRRELPPGLDALTATVSHAVRDADKLDIFRVLEDQVAAFDWQGDSRAFWNLPVSAPPNPVVVADIEAGRPVDYQTIRSLADFVLIQIGWMISGLFFATSRRVCAAGGHVAFRRAFLRRLTDDPAAQRVCDLAEKRLAQDVGAPADVFETEKGQMVEVTVSDILAELAAGTRVILQVRHAERPKIDPDDPSFGDALGLTEEGCRTARLLGERLGAFSGDVVFLSSPLRRTRLTAELIAEGMGRAGAPVTPHACLGNETFYFRDPSAVLEVFKPQNFFDACFEYMATGRQRGFNDLQPATDALESWLVGKAVAPLTIATTHDLYVAAFLAARGAYPVRSRDTWPRFLDAAALLIGPDGTRRYAFVRTGLSDGIVGVSPGGGY
jgi:hypothetical protein